MQGYLDHRSSRSRGDQSKFVNARHAVLEFKTGLHPPAEITRHYSQKRCDIRLRHTMRGVREMLGEIAIIGQENQALRINIQPTHMEKALGAIKDEVTHTRATALITHCRHHADGLIDGKNQSVFGSRNSGAIDVYRVKVGIDPHPLLAHCLSVDTHPALFDELLAGTATPDTCLSEHLLQADTSLRLTRHD